MVVEPNPILQKYAQVIHIFLGLKIKKIFGKHHPDVILYSCIVQVKPKMVLLRKTPWLPCHIENCAAMLRQIQAQGIEALLFWRSKQITNLNRSQATKTKHPTNIDPTVAYKNGQDVSGKSWEYWLNHGVSVYLREFQCSLGSTQLEKPFITPKKPSRLLALALRKMIWPSFFACSIHPYWPYMALYFPSTESDNDLAFSLGSSRSEGKMVLV